MSQPDDAELIAAAKRGAPDAINSLFERLGPRLLALIRLRIGPQLRNHIESGDIMQETMLRAFRNIDRLEAQQPRSVMAWLGAIARNEIREQARFFGRAQRDVRRTVGLDKAEAVVSEQVRSEVSRIHLQTQARELEQAIESLPENHREVIVLRRFEELSFADVGKRMNKSPDAARMLYARAMTALTLNMRRHHRNSTSE